MTRPFHGYQHFWPSDLDLRVWPTFKKTLTLAIASLPVEVGLSYFTCAFCVTRPKMPCHDFWPSDLDLPGSPSLKKLSWTMTVESVGLLIVAIYTWLPPASYVVFLTTLVVGVIPHLQLRIPEIHIFRIFLQHALTYWAEILHMTLFNCTSDQVRVSLICVNFCRHYAPFGTKSTENSKFSVLFSFMLLHIELKFCIWICFTVIQIKLECPQFASMFVGVVPLCGT